MYFLNNGNGTPVTAYKSVAWLYARFQEQIVYKS
jgi:hypothetical protein